MPSSFKITVPGLQIGHSYIFTKGAQTTFLVKTLSPFPPGAEWITDGAEFVADQTEYYLIALGSGLTGVLPDATLTEVAEVALPTAGLPLEPHQVYVLPIALSERDYSLQFRLTNTTGSLRLRSLRVKATPLKG